MHHGRTPEATYRTQATRGMDFSLKDHIDFQQYNDILSKGLMRGKPHLRPPRGSTDGQIATYFLNSADRTGNNSKFKQIRSRQ